MKLDNVDINTLSPGSTHEIIPYVAYNITGTGTEFGCHEAQCSGRFSYVEFNGDFDVWCRIEMVQNSIGHCATAGIMARVSTDPASPLVKIVANSFNRVWAEYDPWVMGVRYRPGGHLPQDDSWLSGYWYCIPPGMVNHDIAFPNAWVRLVRRGNTFTGYLAQTMGMPTEDDWQRQPITFALGGGPDGPTFRDEWETFPQTLLVGLCLEANVEGDPQYTAWAQFRDIHGLNPDAATRCWNVHGETNRPVEISFDSVRSYEDPFNEVILDVLFTEPQGQQMRVPAFWAGGNIWRVRYASPHPGRHRFVTVCQDSSNTSLHGIAGEINLVPYAGDNPLFHHGPLCVADDHRHLAHLDGTPFLWLGDTWWFGLSARVTWNEFQLLTADRKKKGFNVIQIIAGPYGDMHLFDPRSANEGGHSWQEGLSRINPSYYDMADRRLQHLVENGIMPLIVGSWGYLLQEMGLDTMQKHWRNLIARYGAFPSCWCLSGETTMPWYLSASPQEAAQSLRRGWSEMARFVHAHDPFHRLVTTHGPHMASGRSQLEEPGLLDFDLPQPGHGVAAHLDEALRFYVGLLTQEPQMPVVNGECLYEGIFERIGAEVQRSLFWATMLSGGAGFTYGAIGLVLHNRLDDMYGASPNGATWSEMLWHEACQLAGATQVGIGKAVLAHFPWSEFTPHPEWVSLASEQGHGYLQYFSAGILGYLRVIYFPGPLLPFLSQPLVTNIEHDVVYQAMFINPLNGKEYPLGIVEPDSNGVWQIPVAPVMHDWVLVMQAGESSEGR
jgi:hypothetical protein